MVRNFQTRISRPSRPYRRWRKKTGPGEVNFIHKAIIRHRNAQQQQQQTAENQVAQALGHPVDAVKRRLEYAHHRQAEDVGPAGMQQFENEEIGHHVDRGRGVAQPAEHAADAIFGPHGKCDVNNVHFACPGLCEQVVEIADAPANVLGNIGRAFVAAIVVKADELQAHFRQFFDISRQLKAQFRHADNGKIPAIVTQRAQYPLQQPNSQPADKSSIRVKLQTR